MKGLLLDPTTGRPEGSEPNEPFQLVTLRASSYKFDALKEVNPDHPGFAIRDEMNTAAYRRAMRRAPKNVLELLGKHLRPDGSRRAMKELPHAGPLYEEVVFAATALGTANTGTTEVVLIADVLNYKFPGGILGAGSCVKVSASGTFTNNATATTLTFRERYSAEGSGATGTLLHAAAPAPTITVSQTTASWLLEFLTTVWANPSTATAQLTRGWATFPGATKQTIPATASAAINIDTTLTRLFAATAQMSVAQSIVCQQYMVEWMR